MGYGPNEGDGEERDRFWNDMNRTLDSIGNGYRLCILGDLNGWIEDRTEAGITGAFGVPGEKDNGRVLHFVWVTHILSTSLHNYTRTSAGEEGYVHNVMVVRWMG